MQYFFLNQRMQKPQNSGKEHLSLPVKDSWKVDVLWEHIMRDVF